MKKVILISFLFTLITISTKAQQFNKAIGIRGGLSSGFEYRFYTNDINSYKVLLSTRDRGVQVTALKEFHSYELFDFSEQLVFIYGVGVHAGYERWNKKFYTTNQIWYETQTSFFTGIDGLAALEYTFYELPISVGFEVKPFVDVWGRKTFDIELFDFAFTLKYLF
jgi:hypothetical protein